MNAVITHDAWDIKSLQQLQANGIFNAVAGLSEWQKSSLDAFSQQGFPTRKVEHWKYTNTAAIADQEFVLAGNSTSSYLPDASLDAYRMVFVDGVFRADLSCLAGLPSGIVISDTLSAMDDAKLHRYLKVNDQYETVFSQLNSALMTNGLFVYIPENIVLEKPIHCIFYCGDKADKLMSHPRHILVADKHAQCTVIEEYLGSSASYFNNVVTQIYADEGAAVSHYKLQLEGNHARHIANTLVDSKRSSSVFSYVVSLGGLLSRDDLNIALKNDGASVHLYGLYLPFLNQHIDHHTRVDHLVPHGFSQQVYKGIVGDKGRAVFNGKVVVHPQAQKTTALQSNQNLLLSSSAEVDTKPELEIYADDVKCSHGATVGQLDHDAMFYLRSRGIHEDQAQQLLTRAFAEDILKHIQPDVLADYVRHKLQAKLTNE